MPLRFSCECAVCCTSADIPPVQIGTDGNAALGLRSPLIRAFGDPAGSHEFFTHQRTPSDALPDPEPLLTNLTRGVLEVLAGVREVDQLARWLTEDAYRKLVTRANLATRARSARGVPASRPKHAILSVRHTSPADGVVEAVVDRAGSRAHARRGHPARGHGPALARDIPRPALTR